MSNANVVFQLLLNDFEKAVGHQYEPMKDYVSLAEELISYCNTEPNSKELRRAACIYSINQKFELNRLGIKSFIDYAATKKIYFNYHDKKSIKNYFDSSDNTSFLTFLGQKVSDKRTYDEFKNLFCPLSAEKTIKELNKIIVESGQKQEILNSIFSAYLFNSFPNNLTHSFFSNSSPQDYIPDYYEYLHNCFGNSLKREKAISLLVINQALIDSFDNFEEFKDSLCNYIRYAYNTLSNHCHLSIYIDLGREHVGLKWELYSDIVLYAEKFIEEELKIGYFHPKKIEEQTSKYIPSLNIKDSKFGIANADSRIRIVLS